MTADPWVAPPADGAELLDELYACVRRYVVLPSAEAIDAVVLWIAATHGLPAFEHATRLAVHSPIKRCGKTRLLEVIAALAYNAVPTTNISVPALFRMIDASTRPPTLLLDESDRLFGSAKKDEDNRDLIAVLNNGFRAGNPTWRCVGPMQIPTPFSNYAMAAVVGIGRKPDTIEDRAVNITMRRRLPGETVAKFRLRTDLPRLHETQRHRPRPSRRRERRGSRGHVTPPSHPQADRERGVKVTESRQSAMVAGYRNPRWGARPPIRAAIHLHRN